MRYNSVLYLFSLVQILLNPPKEQPEPNQSIFKMSNGKGQEGSERGWGRFAGLSFNHLFRRAGQKQLEKEIEWPRPCGRLPLTTFPDINHVSGLPGTKVSQTLKVSDILFFVLFEFGQTKTGLMSFDVVGKKLGGIGAKSFRETFQMAVSRVKLGLFTAIVS